MTKKDYVAIASKLNKLYQRINNNNFIGAKPEEIIELVVDRLCEVFADDNVRFQRYKFIEAVFDKTAS